jgi:hypothetical protein
MSIRVLTAVSLIFAAVVIALASLALRTDGERADAARQGGAVAPGHHARGASATVPAAQGLKASVSAATTVFDPAQRRADVVARTARRQYRREIKGKAEHRIAARVSRNPLLLSALRAGDLATARSIAGALLYRKDHISHIEITRGTQPVLAVGKPFVVAAVPTPLRGSNGTPIATLHASIQDVIGFVRLMHRRSGADVVVRGSGTRLETSLPAAAHMKLPKRGPVRVAGLRYHVSYFHETGLLGEPLRVWVLTRG